MAQQLFQESNYWDAVVGRDGRLDGIFYYAVTSTGVFCRPSCPSRPPLRKNVLFFRQRDEARRAGFRPCKRCKPERVVRPDPQIEMVETVCRAIEEQLDEPVRLAALGKDLGLSPFHLQRTFKEITGISPRAYGEACRLRTLKNGLKEGHDVTRSMYDAGYSSSSRLYEKTAGQLGMTPMNYRKNGAGTIIRYSISDSPVGKLLVAATEKGVCAVRLGDAEAELRKHLYEEYASATMIEETPSEHVEAMLSLLDGNAKAKRLPLDIQATAFQRRVWEHLQTIPAGTTQTYTEVAAAIGQPKAVRAVARACAANPIALAIPCHRVVRSDGTLGGYRWGIERKQTLLKREKR